MSKSLPSFIALRTFEAVARLGSFTKAAVALHVTQTAVSHQIKSLETFFGSRVFVRCSPHVRLTKDGELLLIHVKTILSELTTAAERIAEKSSRQTLSISCTADFARLWLLPRLNRLSSEAPDLELEINQSMTPVDFAKTEYHLAIRSSNHEEWPGSYLEKLFDLEFAPVCSPDLMSRNEPIRTLDDLRRQTLLHSDGYQDWEKWAHTQSSGRFDPCTGHVLHDSSSAILAAIAGQGIALAPLFYVDEWLASGELVRPFDTPPLRLWSTYLVHPIKYADHPGLRAFRRFLNREIETRRTAQGVSVPAPGTIEGAQASKDRATDSPPDRSLQLMASAACEN